MNLNFYLLLLLWLSFIFAGEGVDGDNMRLNRLAGKILESMPIHKGCKTCVIFDGYGNRVMIPANASDEEIRTSIDPFVGNPGTALYVGLFFKEALTEVKRLFESDDELPDFFIYTFHCRGGFKGTLESILTQNMRDNPKLLVRILAKIRYTTLDRDTFDMALKAKLEKPKPIIGIKIVDGSLVFCHPKDEDIKVIVSHNNIVYKEENIKREELHAILNGNIVYFIGEKMVLIGEMDGRVVKACFLNRDDYRTHFDGYEPNSKIFLNGVPYMEIENIFLTEEQYAEERALFEIKGPVLTKEVVDQNLEKIYTLKTRILINFDRISCKTCVIFNRDGDRVLISKDNLTEDTESQLSNLLNNPNKCVYVGLFFNEPLDKIARLFESESTDAFPDPCYIYSFTCSYNRSDTLESLLIQNMKDNPELLLRVLEAIKYKTLDEHTFNMVRDKKLRLNQKMIPIKMVDGMPILCDDPKNDDVQVIISHKSVMYKGLKIKNEALNEMIQAQLKAFEVENTPASGIL